MKRTRKLILNRETLRALDGTKLARVVGGAQAVAVLTGDDLCTSHLDNAFPAKTNG
jgi:hypothetical protein